MKIESIDPYTYALRDFRFTGWRTHRYVVFDLEGTGPDHTTDRITQIGAVRLGGEDFREVAAFECLVNPGRPIPPLIADLTGITDERVADAPDFAAASARFRAFCGDAVLVTQCGYEYDFPLLDRETQAVGHVPWTNARLDTKVLFALLHPDRTETFSTDFLCGYYDIDRTSYPRHDALGDARLITRIFQAELAELRRRGLETLATDDLRVRRFVAPPLR